ncbi:MAG: class I SAM-dependent methyltransferase [Vicinamibacterales bacterium]
MTNVAEFYNSDPAREWRRLDEYRTEFAVTMRALRDFLPAPPGNVLDVGGGPGRYAIALAQHGYAVTLVDVAEQNIEFARGRAAEAEANVTGYLVGDARDLSSLTDGGFDAVLLLGPLYHLLDEADRRRAVAEARRVLAPGGTIAAAFLCRFAPFRFSAQALPRWVMHHADRAERILTTGIDDRPQSFTHAYLSRPDEIEPFMRSSGFEMRALVGCEGITAGHDRLVNELQGEAWEHWVSLNYRLGQDRLLHGASDHLLYVGQKAA